MTKQRVKHTLTLSMCVVVHTPGHEDPHTPLPPSFCQESSLELFLLLLQTQPMRLRFTLSLRDGLFHTGHLFHSLVVMIQHLCHGKGKNYFKDAGPVLRLPPDLKDLIFPASAIKARLKQYRHMERHFVNP